MTGDQLSPTGNPRVRIRAVEVLSDAWYVLRRTTFDFEHRSGSRPTSTATPTAC
jgi:hypothetical protein